MTGGPFTTDPGLTFLVLFAAVLLGPLAARALRLPDMAGLLVAGLLVGPTGIGLVARDGLVVGLADVGLLLLMFLAGLDLDLDGMARRKGASVSFGVLSWLLPSTALVVASMSLGLGLPAGLILAAALASHTPLTLSDLTRAGHGARDVTVVTVGATLVTTVLALLTLAAASFLSQSPPAWEYLLFAGHLTLFVGLVLVVVPRMVRWLLTRLARSRELRLTVLLVGMLALAGVSSPLGVEPIVGAFLAGLAFNRYVPAGSALHDRLTSVADGLFIPVFLLATGMLIDVQLLVDPDVLTLAGVLAGTLAVSKLAAIGPVALVSRWRVLDVVAAWSLTVGQAAGALAAVLVGQELDVLGPVEVNAVVLVILVAALAAGLSGQWTSRRLPNGTDDEIRPLGHRVVVPVANPDSAPLLTDVAVAVALHSGGMVLPVSVAPAERADDARKLVADAEQAAVAAGAEAHGQLRVGNHVPGTLANLCVEQEATCVVAGVPDTVGRGLGRVLGPLTASSHVPVLLCHPGLFGQPPTAVRVVASECDDTDAELVARALQSYLGVPRFDGLPEPGDLGEQPVCLTVASVLSPADIVPCSAPCVWVIPPRDQRLEQMLTVGHVGL